MTWLYLITEWFKRTPCSFKKVGRGEFLYQEQSRWVLLCCEVLTTPEEMHEFDPRSLRRWSLDCGGGAISAKEARLIVARFKGFLRSRNLKLRLKGS